MKNTEAKAQVTVSFLHETTTIGNSVEIENQSFLGPLGGEDCRYEHCISGNESW